MLGNRIRAIDPGAFATMSETSATAVQRMHALFEACWERELAENPLNATYIGDTRFNAFWPDLRPAAQARSELANHAALAELDKLLQAGLPAEEQLNAQLFRHELLSRLAVAPFAPLAWAISAREGPQALNELAELMPLDTAGDFEVWLQRLRGLPDYLAQYQDLLHDAALSGRTQPRLLMQRVLPQLDLQVVDEPQQSPFYSAFRQLPARIPAQQGQALQEAAAQIIGALIVPAYRQFRRFFAEVYLPACRETVGIWDSPDGAAYYANRIAFHTTTTLDAEQIHQIGLAEVARIHGEMQTVMDQLKFSGSKAEFFEHLRTDPQFYCKSEQELFTAYVLAAKKIEPELPKLFGKLPRTPYGVRAIPATSAPNTTAAYYSGPSDDGRRAGFYYVNLYRPEMRPIYEIEVLTAHEAVPGHHLQIALAQEQQDLPKFRRFAGYNAYLEGWALYAEKLGFELGLYQDPYSHFGQLTYDMWRAVRLVVDTGLHAKRWTREQAIDYFRANAAKTEVDIVNEIDRYIGWPGQALSYKIGQIRVLAMRARAEAELGKHFDVRAYHDMLLDGGALPLDLLDGKVDDWIAGQVRQST
jgi:prolyl oligopeptidase